MSAEEAALSRQALRAAEGCARRLARSQQKLATDFPLSPATVRVLPSEVELGFPHLLYYQHLPHLTVVLLHRLLLGQVDLLTLFNLIRYLLLVGFPLTVWWSMRRLGFSVVAGAVAAAVATLLSSNGRYGFDYDSYLWRSVGLYTQLWAIRSSK